MSEKIKPGNRLAPDLDEGQWREKNFVLIVNNAVKLKIFIEGKSKQSFLELIYKGPENANIYLKACIRCVRRNKIVFVEPKSIRPDLCCIQVFGPCIRSKTADPEMHVQADVRKVLFYRSVILHKKLPGERRIIICLVTGIITCFEAKSKIEVPETKVAFIPKLVTCEDSR